MVRSECQGGWRWLQGSLLYCGGKDKRNGVGVIMDPEVKKAVAEVTRHNDRLMSVKVIVHGTVLNVVSGYAPQTGCTQQEKDTFIEDVEALVRGIPANEKVIIGADMNGHVGVNTAGYEGVHGGYGYGSRNEEGISLLEMAQGLDLVIANTCFRRRMSISSHIVAGRMQAKSTSYYSGKQTENTYKTVKLFLVRRLSSSIVLL